MALSRPVKNRQVARLALKSRNHITYCLEGPYIDMSVSLMGVWARVLQNTGVKDKISEMKGGNEGLVSAIKHRLHNFGNNLETVSQRIDVLMIRQWTVTLSKHHHVSDFLKSTGLACECIGNFKFVIHNIFIKYLFIPI